LDQTELLIAIANDCQSSFLRRNVIIMTIEALSIIIYALLIFSVVAVQAGYTGVSAGPAYSFSNRDERTAPQYRAFLGTGSTARCATYRKVRSCTFNSRQWRLPWISRTVGPFTRVLHSPIPVGELDVTDNRLGPEFHRYSGDGILVLVLEPLPDFRFRFKDAKDRGQIKTRKQECPSLK
jgi:hypothetical protein